MFESLRKELQDHPFLTDKAKIIASLKPLLQKAIQKYPSPGIAFSGGVDSALIALLATTPTLYSVALANSDDVSWSKQVAQQLNLPIKTKILSLDEAEEVIKKVVTLLNSTDVTHVGIGCVVFSVLEMAKEDGITTVLGGLGAEEIFGGYKRHIEYGNDLTNIHERLWDGLKDMEVRDFARDLPIANHFNITLAAPFLDKELVKYAMQIDPSLKMNNERRKIILREVALELGLLKEVAFRKKIAAQYSSKFDRAIQRLAKKNGFQLKKEYLQSLIQ